MRLVLFQDSDSRPFSNIPPDIEHHADGFRGILSSGFILGYLCYIWGVIFTTSRSALSQLLQDHSPAYRAIPPGLPLLFPPVLILPCHQSSKLELEWRI